MGRDQWWKLVYTVKQSCWNSNVTDLCGRRACDWSSHSSILGISTGLSQIETKSIRFSKRKLQSLTGEGEIQETLRQWARKQTQMISVMFYRCICYLIMCKSTCAPPYEQGYFELHSCLIKGDGLLSFHKQPIPCSVVPIHAFKFNHARLHPAIGSHNTCKYNLPDKSLRAMKHLLFFTHLPPSFSDVPFHPELTSEKRW